MTNQTDPNTPIEQIKKAEEDAKKNLEQKRKALEEELSAFSAKLKKDTEEFEKDLKENGGEKLETVKKEAGELFKSKMATAESSKNKLLKQAKERMSETVNEAKAIFLNHVKTN